MVFFHSLGPSPYSASPISLLTADCIIYLLLTLLGTAFRKLAFLKNGGDKNVTRCALIIAIIGTVAGLWAMSRYSTPHDLGMGLFWTIFWTPQVLFCYHALYPAFHKNCLQERHRKASVAHQQQTDD